MYSRRSLIAVVVAGIVGTVANSIAVSLLLGPPLLPLLVRPGRYAVAILVALLLPAIYAKLAGLPAHLVALAALTLIPSILAVWVFGVTVPFLVVLAVNAIYAAAAILTWLAIMRRA